MEVKKKAQLQLEKNSGLYFVMGMTLVLALVYTALEWKTFYSDDEVFMGELNIIDVLEPEIPPLVPLAPPPPPPAAPLEIKVVPDKPEIVESIIEIIEPSPTTEIPSPQQVNFTEPEVEETIPFILIEDVPVFPGCKNANDKRVCFQEMMQKHIRKNFKYPENAIAMGLEGKVYVQFTVQKNGTVGEVKLRGPHEVLEKEAARIIAKMPQLTPGKQRGTAVKVPFSIPIKFALQ